MAVNNRQNKGFTLIEVLVAVSILLLVMAIGGNFIIAGFRSITFGSEQETAIATARQAMEIMTKEIRGISNSERGDYPINSFAGDEFIFYSDINYNGRTERVRYYLAGFLLKKEVTEPGPAYDYSGTSTVTTIANHVNNQMEDVFEYYDYQYAEAYNVNDIRLVKLILKINVTPERAPNDFYVETDVSLRNLKSNL